MVNCEHSEAVGALKKAGDQIEMIVMREILHPHHHDPNNENNGYLLKDGEKFSTVVQRDETQGGQFGFSIAGGSQSASPINGNENLYISKVNQHDQQSSLAVGDRLLAINGHETGSLNHEQAIEIIKDGGNHLELLLYREKLTNGHHHPHSTSIDHTTEVRLEDHERSFFDAKTDLLGSTCGQRQWSDGIEYCRRHRSSVSTVWN